MTDLKPGVQPGRAFPRFSDAEYDRRWAAVREMMKSDGLDALLVYGAGAGFAAVQYLSGFIARQPAWLLVLPGEPVLLLHFLNHVPAAQAMSEVTDVRCYWPGAPRAITQLLVERGCAAGTVGVVGFNAVPYGSLSALREMLPDAALRDASPSYNALRWVRSDEEIEWFRASGAMLDDMCGFLAERLRPGLTEYDVDSLIHESFLPQGGHPGIVFVASTSMSNPDRLSPWQFMTGRRLEVGDVVVIEVTANYWGYGAQIHRAFAIGSEPTDLYRDLFAAAESTFEAVCRTMKAGATSEEVVTAAAVAHEHGFGIFDSVVHGEAGKNPELGTPRTAHTLEPWTFREGQVMIVQPNPVATEHRAGLQLGCAVRVGGERAEPLHGQPFVFPVCG